MTFYNCGIGILNTLELISRIVINMMSSYKFDVIDIKELHILVAHLASATNIFLL